MLEQKVAQSAASGKIVIFIEGGRLHVGKLHSSSPRRIRIIDESGQKRRLEMAKVVVNGIIDEPASFIAKATGMAEQLDMELVWQFAGGETLSLDKLAARLKQNEPLEVKVAALQLAHARERAFFVQAGGELAPVDAAKHANICEAREKRKFQAKLEADYDEKLANGSLPPELAQLLKQYIVGENLTQDPGGRSLRRYCKLHNIDPAQLALDHKLVESPAEILLAQIKKHIPKAQELADFTREKIKLSQLEGDGVAIDSADTKEVDDAFTCNDDFEVSVCIAAPGLGIPAAALDQANQRMVSVYLPGKKYPMLPEKVITAYTLRAPQCCPVVAMTHQWDGKTTVGDFSFALAELGMHANLPVEQFANDFGHPQVEKGGRDAKTLARLAKFATTVARSDARGSGERGHLVGLADGEPFIHERANFASADDMVANLMVHYNHCAARFLQERNYPFIARHEGRCVVSGDGRYGDAGYGWFSSPLRRLVDLFNQQQLIAAITESPSVHSIAELLKFLPAFERCYQRARQMQQKLETYWSIVWLNKQPKQSWQAKALATPGRVRLKRLPLVAQLEDLNLEVGSMCEVEINDVDLLRGRVTARLS